MPNTPLLIVGAFAVIGLVCFGFWVWALLDAAKRPTHQWEAAGENKTLFLVLMVAFGVLGSLMYLLSPRPKLQRLQAQASVNFDPTAFGVPDGGMTYGEGGFRPQS